MRRKVLLKRFIAMTFVLIMAAGSAWAATLTVTDATGDKVDVLTVPITVDEAEKLAGSAFTLEYDNALTVTVSSDFFDTFYNQFSALDTLGDPDPNGGEYGNSEFPVLDGPGGSATGETIDVPVVVDATSHYQPLLTNTVENGTTKQLISAARCIPAEAGGATLFTLEVSLKGGQSGGDYDITIIPTTLNNTDAGYAAEGEEIDLLVGSDLSKTVGDPLAFPPLLTVVDYNAGATSKGTMSFTLDEDNDGVGDDWEIEKFGSIEAKDGTADSDSDGYSDLWEYKNDTDPNVKDPAGGEGYDCSTDDECLDWMCDVDDDGTVDPFTDGILIIRYLFDYSLDGPTWINGVVAQGANRADAAAIENYMKDGIDNLILDIDGDGTVDPFTDGILIIRYLFDYSLDGPTWINGVVAQGATRSEAGQIEAYLSEITTIP